MTSASPRPALILATTVALGLAADAMAAERKPVLEYVRPGANVTFVSALEPPKQDVDGWTFVVERWSDYTLDEIQDVERKGQRIKLVFANGSMSGVGPCNTLSASYTVEAGTMRIGPVSRSKKMCPDPDAMAMEEKLVEFLEKVDRMERIGPTLVMRTSDDGMMTLWGAQTIEESATDQD
jgi:heat shock protein HslJ